MGTVRIQSRLYDNMMTIFNSSTIIYSHMFCFNLKNFEDYFVINLLP